MAGDYLSVIIEHGFAILFGAVNPLLFILLLINIQINFNNDLIQMSTSIKRPIPKFAADIGLFKYIYIFMIGLSVVINSHIFAYNSNIPIVVAYIFNLKYTNDVIF